MFTFNACPYKTFFLLSVLNLIYCFTLAIQTPNTRGLEMINIAFLHEDCVRRCHGKKSHGL